jgi:hypothetical protein
MPCAALPLEGSLFDVVDIFDVTSGAWSTAALSVARYMLSATSLPNHGVAIFAGGMSMSTFWAMIFFATLRVGESDG